MIVHQCDNCGWTMIKWVTVSMETNTDDPFEEVVRDRDKDIKYHVSNHRRKEYCPSCFYNLFMGAKSDG